MKKMNFKGTITRIYEDKRSHYEYCFEIKTDSDIFEINAEDWRSHSWEYATVGDSIIKPADTLMIIIKKNDSTFKKFSYHF